ncbi:hypothetical protein F2Q68_00044359 [Brassica cretica]|uniref:ENTH domain-containing protein n=1 Tax=Brassica cretica TaxID=69181 RepID=A0A8S9LET8_BRACR|nr:hypothetical protein F2Q68_00044359 [Brassica cretica]
MRLHLSAKFRQVLGHAKDQASIGRAIVQNYNEKSFFDIEVAVVRATSHDDCPVGDKTMHEILFHVSNTPGAVPFLAEQISRRLAKTRDYLVAGKTLLLIHRLLRSSSRCIEQQLHIAHTSGHLQIGCCWFMMSQDHPSFAFLQNYVAYLEERVGWIINQAGKLEPVMSGGEAASIVTDQIPSIDTNTSPSIDTTTSPSIDTTTSSSINTGRVSEQKEFDVCGNLRDGETTTRLDKSGGKKRRNWKKRKKIKDNSQFSLIPHFSDGVRKPRVCSRCFSQPFAKLRALLIAEMIDKGEESMEEAFTQE